MSVFVDTSAILALLDATEESHGSVADAWDRAVEAGRPLVTSNYVVVESFALAQRRLGMDAVRAVADAFLPLLEVLFVTSDVHSAAMAALLAADRRRLSFVDCTSFELMRRRGIRDALALDADFAKQGFGLLPGAAAGSSPS